MALDLKKSIRGLTFLTKRLPRFGGKSTPGDQYTFDSRGAIRITDQEVTKRNGEVIKVRGIVDAGMGTNPMVITRPGGSTSSITSARAMTEYHSWPYAAIKPIADEMAGIEWRLFQKKGKQKSEIETHQVLDLLEAVNSFQTGPEFRKILATHLELTGNVYILLLNKAGDPVSSDSEKPAGLFLLDPSRVKVNLNQIKFPYSVTGYTMTIDSKDYKYETYQIIHIKDPDPSNPWIGKGTVQGIAEWIANENAATEFLNQFYENGAQIGVTFETDMAGEDQLQMLRDSFNEQHSGVRNAYKAIFLPKGVKKPANDVKFDDVGFDDTSDKNRDKILAGFRVPKTILGAAESDTNRATAETADYVFAKRTVKPKMLMVCSYLNEFLVPRFGDNLILTFTDPVPEDRLSKSTEMMNATGGIPVITPNEAREEFMGLEPAEGGDVFLTPNNFIPIEDAGKISSSAVALSVKGKTRESRGTLSRKKIGYMPLSSGEGKTQTSRNAIIRKELTDSMAEKITEIITGLKKKGVNEMTNDEYEVAILKSKRDRAEAAAKDIDAELKKLNKQQMEEVLRKIDEAVKSYKGNSKKAVLHASKLFDFDKWVNLTINAITPIATRIFKNEAEIALNVIDKPGLDVANTPAAKNAITHAMELMAQSYNQNTVDILEAKLTEGLEQGYGIPQLSNLVKDIYAFKDTYAAERVALTESNRITNTAGKIAWRESGVVTEIKWVTLASDACPFCKDMDGDTIAINENFFNKGDDYKVDGAELNFDYSAVGGPPLHPNCRCGIKPVVSTNIES